mgnify:CR=1 FL=1
MGDVLSGFFTIWFVIGIGWLLAHLKVLDHTAQSVLSKVSFFVGLPALLFSSLRVADLERIFSYNVLVSSLAIFITLACYLVLASTVWQRSWRHKVIVGYCASYVISTNIGLPIAASKPLASTSVRSIAAPVLCGGGRAGSALGMPQNSKTRAARMS